MSIWVTNLWRCCNEQTDNKPGSRQRDQQRGERDNERRPSDEQQTTASISGCPRVIWHVLKERQGEEHVEKHTYILLTLMLAWMGNSRAITTSNSTLATSPNPSVVGQAVTLTTTVTATHRQERSPSRTERPAWEPARSHRGQPRSA
jgi:hypothetical protein